MKLVEELITDNKLLIVNELDIVKAKSRFKETRNKEKVMTRAEKTKTKFIKRDSFDFKHVKVNFRRDDRDDRDDCNDYDDCDDRDNYDDRDNDDDRSNKEIKKFFVTNIVTIMKVDIQAIEKANAVINRDV